MIDSYHLGFHHVLKKACGSQPNDPVACLANLGWVCLGPTLVADFPLNSHLHSTQTHGSSQIREIMPYVSSGSWNPWGSKIKLTMC